MFARFGVPEEIVSDNGPCFTSQEFTNLTQSNGIHHIKSAPYHPAKIGLTERAVQVLKEGLKKNAHGALADRAAMTSYKQKISEKLHSLSHTH